MTEEIKDESLADYVQRLKQENEKLKELNKTICEDWTKQIEFYWQALEEIREIAGEIAKEKVHNPDIDIIVDKINEVLGNEMDR